MHLNGKRVFTAVMAAFALNASNLSAQWWNPADPTPPKDRGTRFAAKVAYTHQTALDAGAIASAALWNDDFAKLDRMYEELLDVRATDGTSMIAPIAKIFEQAGSSPVFDKTIERWAQRSPASRLRPLAMAIRWEGDAWRARGMRYASSTPDEAMQIFRQRLGRATDALAAAEQEGRNSPIWYWTALSVGGATGRPAAQLDALFEEAVAKFPVYQPIYYVRANYLLPKWGGSWEAVDDFVNASVARTREREGDAFYAWLYVAIARAVDGDVFHETHATWPRMKKGFEDMLARHPDPFNKNLFAHFACSVHDRETTARLLTELGKNSRLGNWSDGVTTESCQRFALTGA